MKAAALGLVVWLVLLGLLLAAESNLASGVGFSGLPWSKVVVVFAAVALYVAVVLAAAFFPDLVLGQKVFSRSSKVVFAVEVLAAPSCRLLLIAILVLLIARGGTCGHTCNIRECG